MNDQPQHLVGRVGPTVLQIDYAPDLEALGMTVLERMKEQAANGLMLRSVSHAVDPAGGEQKWSVLMWFTELRDHEIKLEPAD